MINSCSCAKTIHCMAARVRNCSFWNSKRFEMAVLQNWWKKRWRKFASKWRKFASKWRKLAEIAFLPFAKLQFSAGLMAPKCQFLFCTASAPCHPAHVEHLQASLHLHVAMKAQPWLWLQDFCVVGQHVQSKPGYGQWIICHTGAWM